MTPLSLTEMDVMNHVWLRMAGHALEAQPPLQIPVQRYEVTAL